MSDAVARIEARQAIAEGMYRYCRGIDRMDREVLASVFHPGATVDYPYFSGTPGGFADWIWPSHATFDIHSHQVTNIMIDLDDDATSAVTEAYVTAALWRSDPDGDVAGAEVVPGHDDVDLGIKTGIEHVVRARYFDSWSVKAGVWAMDYRRCVSDTQTIHTATGLVGEGRRDLKDPSYDFLATRGPSRAAG